MSNFVILGSNISVILYFRNLFNLCFQISWFTLNHMTLTNTFSFDTTKFPTVMFNTLRLYDVSICLWAVSSLCLSVYFYWNVPNLSISVPFVNSYQKIETEGYMGYPCSWENDYLFKHLSSACHAWWFILSTLWNPQCLIFKSPSSDGPLWTSCLKEWGSHCRPSGYPVM